MVNPNERPAPCPTAQTDMVNHPPHYKGANGIEAIQVIEAFDLPFCLANVVKYVLRSGKKGNRTEDLRKASWYLSRQLEAWEAGR